MKRLRCALAIGVATFVIPVSISIAQIPGENKTSGALGVMQAHLLVRFETCNFIHITASNYFDDFGANAPKTLKAYKEFGACVDAASTDAEARFADLKDQLASNEAGKAALKELYIYWRTEMASGSIRPHDSGGGGPRFCAVKGARDSKEVRRFKGR